MIMAEKIVDRTYCKEHGWVHARFCVLCKAIAYKERMEAMGGIIELPEGDGPEEDEPGPLEINLMASRIREENQRTQGPESIRDRPIYSRINLRRIR